jgi:hypothetical protein
MAKGNFQFILTFIKSKYKQKGLCCKGRFPNRTTQGGLTLAAQGGQTPKPLQNRKGHIHDETTKKDGDLLPNIARGREQNHGARKGGLAAAATQGANAHAEPLKLLTRIDTTYRVSIRVSETSKETIGGKILKLSEWETENA